MNKEVYIQFLDNNYKNAVDLSNKFKKTRILDWTALDILNELSVQISHVFNIFYKNYSEKNRKINNLGDELSDVILQLIALSDLIKINLYSFQEEDLISSSNIEDLTVLFGQLVEANMEINNKRFYKKREDYESHEEFIISIITKMMSIVFNVAKIHNLDLDQEFNDMYKDASGFLKVFRKNDKGDDEYIDVYDADEKYQGIYKRKILNNSNYYAKTVNMVYINPYKRTIYLQLKNAKHNNVFTRDLCELTVGGHLTANESISICLFREAKEETGLDLAKSKIKFYTKRKQKLVLKKKYKINEFQYYYFYVDNITLDQLKPDGSESKKFIEVKVKDLLSLIKDTKKIIKGLILVNGRLQEVKLTIANFNTKFFVQDEIVKNILLESKKYFIPFKAKVKEKKKINKLIKEISKRANNYDISVENNENFETLNVSEISNNDLKYYIMLSKEYNQYVAHMFIYANEEVLAEDLLYKKFDLHEKCTKYYYHLINYVKKHDNITILTRVLEEMK